MAISDFDSIFTYIGGFGRYQMMLFAENCFINILFATVYYGQFFMILTPPHWCRPSPDLDELALTVDQVKELTIPKNPDTGEFSKCTRYDVDVTKILQANVSDFFSNANWTTTSCTYGWDYNYSLYYPTITSQLNWVCLDDWKPAVSQSLFFIGSAMGQTVLGWAADKWGRLPVIVGTNVVGGVIGIASAYANSIVSFTALRFIVGMTYDTHFVVAYVLFLEYVSSKYRTVMANVPIMTFLTATMCALPWIAYSLGNWSYFTIAIHAPQLLCIAFIWWLPESARWLLGKGRTDDALKIILTASRVNGKTLSPEVIQDFKEFGAKQAEETNDKVSAFDLLRTPVLRLRFIVLCVIWLTITLAYDGHMRNSENIGFNVFISFTVLAFVELPADFLTIISTETLGRKHTSVFTLILSGVACLVIAAIPPNYIISIFSLAIVGRFLITMSMNVVMQYSVEVLPTVARSSGCGIIHTLGSLSAFASPYVVYLSKYGHYLPYLILGVVTIVGGAICSLLPETINEKLPDSLLDGETYFAEQGYCYNPCSGRKRMKVTPTNEKALESKE